MRNTVDTIAKRWSAIPSPLACETTKEVLINSKLIIISPSPDPTYIGPVAFAPATVAEAFAAAPTDIATLLAEIERLRTAMNAAIVAADHGDDAGVINVLEESLCNSQHT